MISDCEAEQLGMSTGAARLFIVIDLRCASRQHIPQIEEDCVVMGDLWLARRYKPGAAVKVGVLPHELQRTILRVSPKRLREAYSPFLDSAVLP